MKLQGKVIVITGATSGIGLDLLTALWQRGDCTVCAIGRNAEKLELLKKSFGNNLTTIVCDVQDHAQIDALFAKLYTRTETWPGTVDVFIANAGKGLYEKNPNLYWQTMEDIFALNVYAPLYALGKMRAANQGRPFQFVITASGMAKAPLHGYALYAATKSALDAFARSYNLGKPRNIQLSVVYPVAIVTPFYKKIQGSKKIPLVRQSRQKNCTNILRGIESDTKYIYPSLLFRIYLVLRNFLPLTLLYTQVEKFRMNHVK